MRGQTGSPASVPVEKAGKDLGAAGKVTWSADLGVTGPRVRILSNDSSGTRGEWLRLLRPGSLTGRAWLG